MSTNLTDAKQCPNCGQPLPSGALAGLCPACLLAQGTVTDTHQGWSPHFQPPPLADIARLFPQLEILGLLGAGGMGAVYKARQPALDRFVALKVLPTTNARGVNFAERFNREGRALARLSHPDIVAVHEFGQAGSLHFFIMEYVDGANLRQLGHGSRISPREALQIIPQICDALQYAHDEGVVHRDIKPENVLVDRKGRVKIADFGLAKILGYDAEAARLTESRDRVSSAIKNSGFDPPHKWGRITVNLAPADLPKASPIYDLPVALGFLLAIDQINFDHKNRLFVGELALDGKVRSIHGVLPIALLAKEKGIEEIYVPRDNAPEASVIEDLTIIPVDNLYTLVSHLAKLTAIEPYPPIHLGEMFSNCDYVLDISHIRGQEHAKRAPEIAAAGGHNIILNGPPGSGKTLLAKTVPSILPRLTPEESLEITKIFCAALDLIFLSQRNGHKNLISFFNRLSFCLAWT